MLETIRGDDAKTKFYTGLPTWTPLLGLFTYLEKKASRMHLWRGEKEQHKRSECGVYGKGSGGSRSGRRLSLMEELLAALVRFRLGLNNEMFARNLAFHEVIARNFNDLDCVSLKRTHLTVSMAIEGPRPEVHTSSVQHLPEN